MVTPEENFMNRLKEISMLYYQEKSGTNQDDPLENMRLGLKMYLDNYLPSDFPQYIKENAVDYIIEKSFTSIVRNFKK